MERSLSAGDLVRLREEREVDIVTRAAPAAPVHETTIWVVVDRHDRVLVRTYLGPDSRWYREALAHPDVLLRLGDDLLTFTASPATDADRVEACSDGLLRKYAGDPSAPAMVADKVLGTTLELVPR